MSTIKDVAQLAGVSVSTVSRVVNGNSGAASEETRRKIWDAVRETNYSANESARVLRAPKDSPPVAKAAVDCVFARDIDYFIDPFFVELIHVIEQALFRKDYRIRCQYGIQDIESHAIASRNKRDAAIILGRVDTEILEKLKNSYRHLVYVSLQDRRLGIDSVMCSGYESAIMGIDYLISIGHEKIVYLGETKNEQRFNAYMDCVEKYGLEKRVIDVRFNPGDSYEAMKQAFENGLDCTAVFCANDISAVGVYRAAKERRLSIPKDLSVIGLNDIDTVRYLDPMLTTIHIPIRELGILTANTLVDRMEHGHELPVRSYLPCQLIERDSCRSLK